MLRGRDEYEESRYLMRVFGDCVSAEGELLLVCRLRLVSVTRSRTKKRHGEMARALPYVFRMGAL